MLHTVPGASGLRSNVSCCGGPPSMYKRMHAFAVPVLAEDGLADAVFADAMSARACPAKSWGSESPIADSPPTCKIVRRASGVEALNRLGCMQAFQIGTSNVECHVMIQPLGSSCHI